MASLQNRSNREIRGRGVAAQSHSTVEPEERDSESSHSDSDDDNSGSSRESASEIHRQPSGINHGYSKMFHYYEHEISEGKGWFSSLILCSNTFTFWIIKTLLIFAEPPLLSFQVPPNALVSKLMVIVLGVSTLLFVMQLFSDVIVRKNEIDKHWIEMINSLELPGNSSSSGKSRIAETKKKAGPVRRALNFYLHNTPYWLEGACLMCGIVFTGYGRPGIASLRMFRFFIVLWYHELPVFRKGTIRWAYRFFGTWGLMFLGRIYDVMEFATLALNSLGSEMFFITKRTRGGFILMCILFFTAYVMAVTIQIDIQGEHGNDEITDDDLPHICHSIKSCMYTLLRLTFFDGNGLDLLYDLSRKQPVLAGLTFVYMCVTSFGIINGLLSTFVTAFQNASNDVFDRPNRIKSVEWMEYYVKTKTTVVPIQETLSAALLPNLSGLSTLNSQRAEREARLRNMPQPVAAVGSTSSPAAADIATAEVPVGIARGDSGKAEDADQQSSSAHSNPTMLASGPRINVNVSSGDSAKKSPFNTRGDSALEAFPVSAHDSIGSSTIGGNTSKAFTVASSSGTGRDDTHNSTNNNDEGGGPDDDDDDNNDDSRDKKHNSDHSIPSPRDPSGYRSRRISSRRSTQTKGMPSYDRPVESDKNRNRRSMTAGSGSAELASLVGMIHKLTDKVMSLQRGQEEMHQMQLSLQEEIRALREQRGLPVPVPVTEVSASSATVITTAGSARHRALSDASSGLGELEDLDF